MEADYSKGSCFAERVEEQINAVGRPAEAAAFCMLRPHKTTDWRFLVYLEIILISLTLSKAKTAASSRCALRWELWEVEPTLSELKQYKDRVKKWDLWCSIGWWTQAASNCKDCRHLSVMVLSLCCNSRLGEVKHFFLLPEKMPRSQFDLPCRVHSRPSSSLPGAAIPLPCSATKQRNES